MEKFIGYARTSTGRQILGLEEQEYRIRQFIEIRDGQLVKLFIEQESGKNNHRKSLEDALNLCQKHGHTLLFTKLDRLSREVEFLFALRNRGVKLTCIELPELNTLTLGIFGSVAQWERELISSRTKRGLAELKRKGIKLGSPQNFTQAGRELGLKIIKENKRKNEAWNKAKTYIDHYHLKNGKMNFSKVANELNQNGYKTRTGNLFTAMTVKRLFKKETTPDFFLRIPDSPLDSVLAYKSLEKYQKL